VTTNLWFQRPKPGKLTEILIRALVIKIQKIDPNSERDTTCRNHHIPSPSWCKRMQHCPSTAANLANALLKGFCPQKHAECKKLLQTSFEFHSQKPTHASSNGFVNSAITAYNQHYHLIVRLENVWFAILTQFSCYVNVHAEKLRHKFVSHKDQKELVIKMHGSRYTVDFGWFATQMIQLLEENVVDAEMQ